MWKRRDTRGKLVAHRGGEALANGDVLDGARRLVELGVETAEIDVRCTRDRVLVVHHDPSVRGAAIRDHTYDELIGTGRRLPRLEEFLDIAAGHMALDVELKEPGYEEEVLSETLARIEPELIAMTSFEDSVVATVKRLAPEVSTGLLVGRLGATPALGRLLRDVFPFERLHACRADFLAPHYRLLVTGLAFRAERRGIRLMLWTVNDRALIERYLRDPRVLGVITDVIG